MQYISIGTKDLESGYSTYVLQKHTDRVDFFAYTGDTAIGTDEQGQKINAYNRGYFLRKGFSAAVQSADPEVIEPIYKDENDNIVVPASKQAAISMIYDGKLNISSFKFADGATDEQKKQAFAKLINYFVSASRNADFASEKNLFLVQGNFLSVAYNNGGSQKVTIEGADIQERLGLETPEVAKMRAYRAMVAEQTTKKI